MTDSRRLQFPFKIRPLQVDGYPNYGELFGGFPSGLALCNHWGHKISATVTEKELEDLYNFPLDPRDIWVSTPPKCGTTWAQELVWLLANNLDYEAAKTPLIPDRWSYIDWLALMDKRQLEATTPPPGAPGYKPITDITGDPTRPSPRFIKCHLPMSMNNPRLLDTCKVVYVARNPKDICVSFYHHTRLFKCHDYRGDFETFVEHFMAETLPETPIVQHMVEAWSLRHHPNMCFLFYEDMKRDLKSQIRKVASFLGKTVTEDQLSVLAKHLHIDNFKKNPNTNRAELIEKGAAFSDRGDFVRKGKTGDWKNYFTVEMNEKFDKWLAEKLRGTDLRFVMQLSEQD